MTLTFVSRDLGRNAPLSTVRGWVSGSAGICLSNPCGTIIVLCTFLYSTVVLREGAPRKAPGMWSPHTFLSSLIPNCLCHTGIFTSSTRAPSGIVSPSVCDNNIMGSLHESLNGHGKESEMSRVPAGTGCSALDSDELWPRPGRRANCRSPTVPWGRPPCSQTRCVLCSFCSRNSRIGFLLWCGHKRLFSEKERQKSSSGLFYFSLFISERAVLRMFHGVRELLENNRNGFPTVHQEKNYRKLPCSLGPVCEQAAGVLPIPTHQVSNIFCSLCLVNNWFIHSFIYSFLSECYLQDCINQTRFLIYFRLYHSVQDLCCRFKFRYIMLQWFVNNSWFWSIYC